MSRPNGAWRVFRTPLLLAVVSGVGLVAALLAEGGADALWTLAVAFPVLVIGWALFRARG